MPTFVPRNPISVVMPLSQLQPASVWHYFGQICTIPRPSKQEEQILSWLKAFAGQHNLSFQSDAAGNLRIDKPATPGYENAPVVALQAHVDMVCEKHSYMEHDFALQPIVPRVEGEWVKAHGTTLGADDGIGMAAILAVLADKEATHGRLEALFTVDEESGLTGAFALSGNFLSASMLINLDSEDEGELFIGCAGGIDTTATFSAIPIDVTGLPKAYRIALSGLKGGHSGDDIHRGRGNAIQILSSALLALLPRVPFALARFEGGNLRNAIPREATAVIVTERGTEVVVETFLSDFFAREAALLPEDRGLTWLVTDQPTPQLAADSNTVRGILESLAGCPNGVIAWSETMEDTVETSTNLASVKMEEPLRFLVATSQRSFIEKDKREMAARIKGLFEIGGAVAVSGEGYPGWEPNPSSQLLNAAKTSYCKLFGQEPKVRAIHAGLECGLFLEKYPMLDMISFGPTLRDVHSPDERLHIRSVDKFYRLLVALLGHIAKQDE